MSVVASFRKFIKSFPSAAQPIAQVAQQRVPESYDPDNGFIWFTLRGTNTEKTLNPVELDGDNLPVNTNLPDELLFDVEIYHPDIGVVEMVANLLHRFDTYGGAFGDGTIGVMFVEDQNDDYVPQVQVDEDVDLSFAYLRVEIRLYKEG